LSKEPSNHDNSKILIPFLKAGMKVLSEISNVKFNKKEVYPFKGNKSIGDVKIEIPVIGDIETRVIFDMPRDFAFKLAKSMVGDMNAVDDINLLQSAILELGNMISGNAMGFLEEVSLDCDIKTPKAYVGPTAQLFNAQTHIGVIEFTSEMGDFNIYVVLKEEKTLDATGILLLNITEIIANHIIEFFIPRGFSVYSATYEEDALKVVEKQEIVMVFINLLHNYSFNPESFIEKAKALKPNLRFLFYAAPNEWNGKLAQSFPGAVLGYIPRAFDAQKTSKALVMVLDKVGVKYNQQRRHVRIALTSDDKAMAIILKDLHGEGEKNMVNATIEDISIGGALFVVQPSDAEFFKERMIFPRCQIKLKGFVIRAKIQIVKKNENSLGVLFMEITDDDIKKISYFIHQKLAEVVKN